MQISTLTKAACGAVVALAALSAHAGQVLNNGSVSIGVQDMGALGFGGVGLAYTGYGDAITPGCLCEGWGASAGGVRGWSANANGGNVNVSLASFTSDAMSATSVVNIGGAGLQVSQTYSASASSSLWKDTVTLTNTTGSTITDVRYSRSMDWDIPPTTFNEFVTLQGVGATALLYSNDNGFATPDTMSTPSELSAGTTNVNFVDSGPNDHGAFFIFGFGDLEAGESVTFDIFYGAAGNESMAYTALGEVGAEVYSLGLSNSGGKPAVDSATYIFAFSGVGGTPVPPTPAIPEPETYAMMLMGLGVLGWTARRRRNRHDA